MRTKEYTYEIIHTPPSLASCKLYMRYQAERPRGAHLPFIREDGGKKGISVATIIPLLRDSVFEPDQIKAMSMALDAVCEKLKLEDDNPAREAIATRIIDLARRGERSPIRLRDGALREARLAKYALEIKERPAFPLAESLNQATPKEATPSEQSQTRPLFVLQS